MHMLYLSIYLHMYVCVCLFVCPFTYVSVHQIICSSIRPSIHPFIHYSPYTNASATIPPVLVPTIQSNNSGILRPVASVI